MSDIKTRRELRGKGHGRPTMTDVARIAGVSQSSVSLVLNAMSGARISADTQQRVFDAARQIGYALPSIRRNVPASAEHRTIAYLVDEISTSPHPVINLDGARDLAFEHDILVATHVTRSNPELESAIIEKVAGDPSVIGVIYSTIFTRRVTLPEGLGGIPTVLLNCYERPKRHACVVPDEITGGRAATAHLTALGHRRIGFINGEPWMDASHDRLDGYRSALEAIGVSYDPELVRNGDWLPLTGYQHALDLMRLRQPPTAILCGNDLMAMGALEATREIGRRVPDDISIMGYDDQELARYTHPPLSTLVLPNYEMGQKAAAVLLDMIGDPKTAARTGVTRIRGALVPRSTTAGVAVAPHFQKKAG